MQRLKVYGPLGRPSHEVDALFVIKNGRAFVDLESFAGKDFSKHPKYKSMQSSSHSLGQVLRHLYERRGIKNVVIGASNSCYSDYGIGCLFALDLFICHI